ncbi:hypothetical protein KS4_05040 [Poriferisphaera corsica]|uniref:YheU family protein n=1 Tax=Poriferisphaera corsica TaxID=2528020 RepID=A0A517YQG8_9BACT|nr:YheU family protein [Poriferisphaera corsica]QDU32472.1 hypothetical protein KS4_05040 [Poriferisphaera corsica]
MIIPVEKLSKDALEGLVQEYVTRDGTELGEMGAKTERVMGMVKKGELLVVFDEVSESVNLMTEKENQEAEVAREREAAEAEGYEMEQGSMGVGYEEAEQAWEGRRGGRDEGDDWEGLPSIDVNDIS